MSEANRRWVLKHTLASAFACGASSALAQPARNSLSALERSTLAAIANAFLKNYDMPGLSVAIVRHGRLAYAEGFGIADIGTGERVTADHLFRVASVSKPITSVGIFALMEQGRLRLTDKVFGADGILGTEFEAPSRRFVGDITIGHLLTHLGGGWSNKPNDPMDADKQMSHRSLISWTLKEHPLKERPGATFAYSNFGYCVLGRVIEKVSQKSYSDHVRDAVLARCGITEMRIAGNSREQRAAREVTYYHRSLDPYAINMTRNDSTGGWLGSATDLALFAAHVSGFDHPPNILKPATIKTMTTPWWKRKSPAAILRIGSFDASNPSIETNYHEVGTCAHRSENARVAAKFCAVAEREGFEPPIRLPVCRISSAVHSTTLPPLRNRKWPLLKRALSSEGGHGTQGRVTATRRGRSAG